MAISLVQTVVFTYSSSSTSQNVTVASTGANALIVVYSIIQPTTGSGPHVNSVTDNQSNTYTKINASQTGGVDQGNSDIYYSQGSTSGVTTVTVNFDSSSSSGIVYVQEYSGVATSGALDQFAGLTQNSTAIDNTHTPTITPTVNNELVVAIAGDGLNAGITAVSSPYILDDHTTPFALCHLIQTTASSTMATFTNGFGSMRYISEIASFQAGVAPLTLTLMDSVSSSDSMSDAFSVPLSDNASSSDSAPDSFSVQSDFVVPTVVPAVEKLATQFVPAQVKTYFNIQE
jgi:hypothetical protein